MDKKIPEVILRELAESAQRLSKELHEQLAKMSKSQNTRQLKDSGMTKARN